MIIRDGETISPTVILRVWQVRGARIVVHDCVIQLLINQMTKIMYKVYNVFFIIPFTKKTEMQNAGPNSRTTTARKWRSQYARDKRDTLSGTPACICI